MIVIIGAGLAGLSTAYHLKKKSYIIIEKESEVGGLCRSYTDKGFTFDYTGHLIHMKHPYTKRLLNKLIPQGIIRHTRKAFIYLNKTYIPYPFQANTYALPRETNYECLKLFLDTKENKKSKCDGSFYDWIINNFGMGMARHFFIPYNRKLWKTDLKTMTCEWVNKLIPRPSLDEVIKGALGINSKNYGYNAVFFYPERGGIVSLPKSFLRYLKNLYFGREVKKIDWRKRRVILNSGEVLEYEKLISTMPLPELIKRLEGCPDYLINIGNNLKYVSVLNLNLGIDVDGISKMHWIYFPDDEIPFYRIGFPSNFSRYIIPHKKSSMYVEATLLPEKKYNDNLINQMKSKMVNLGILNNNMKIITEKIFVIDYAYVIYDKFRKKNLPILIKFLRENNIYSIGRFGSWQYLSMEDVILQGKEISGYLS